MGKFEGAMPLQYPFPPHAKNTSPYYGEGDKGGKVNKILYESSRNNK
jgi:hypothetical protein